MGLFSIVGGLGKKIVDRKKKKMKRRMIIIAIIILVVFFVIPIVLFAKNFRDNLRMAAISSSNENVDGDGNWYTRDGTNGKKNKKKIRVAKSISMDAGFTGLGYDFHAAIAGSNNNDAKYYAYQTLELLDVMSIEAKQPFTLYGIGLLTKECNYFTSYKSESRRALFFPAGTDIYTHRGEYSRAPGIGGGRLWHSKGSTYESARAATDAPQNDWIVQKSSGDWGYWNAGAFGFAQLETYIWLDSSPNGAAKYSEKGYATIDLDSKGGEISSMDKYEAYCRRVMEAVGHADFIAEADANAAANGYNHEGQYLKYIRDVNMATSACFLSCARLANCGSYFPNDKMGGTKTSGCWTVTNGGDIDILNMGQGISGIDTSYMKLENLNEMELNVLSAMVGLSGWNGGYSGWLTNGKSGVTEDKKYQRMLAYDLAKFLVANGAEPFYSGGYKELSNKCYVSASSEQGKKLSSDFALITQLLYKNDQAKQTAVYNHFSQYWSGGTAKYIAYVYMLDGIIRAQQTFDDLGLVANDGSKKNIYACVYEGTVVTVYEEYYEDGSDIDEAGAVTDANTYLNMDAAIVAFGSGTMIEDWCTKPGKQFNFDGVDVEAQAAIIKMITEGHAIWRHNQDLLLQKGWLRPESYLSIRERYDIPSEYFRDIYNYILTQHKENWPAEQRIVYYSQSKHRIYSIKNLLNKSSSDWSDFDCSSFMSYLLLKINVDLADVHSTGSFDGDLQKLGFTLVDTGSLDYSKLRTGDIINVSGSHIAMVVFPGTKKSDTWILESVTTSNFRFKWDTGSYSANYGVGSSENTCCGPSITLHNNEARESNVKVWRLNKNVKFSTN